MHIPILLLIIGVPALLSWPLGRYLTRVMHPDARTGTLHATIECWILRIAGSAGYRSQNWKTYAVSLLVVNGLMFIVGGGILAFQQWLPWNPDGRGGLDPSLVFHTAASFLTNTNQQHYAGEVSLSHFSQVFGLMWLQFLSAATGLAALAALARVLAGSIDVGNFFQDLLRATILVLLPLSLASAVLLVLAGVPMTLEGAVTVRTLEGVMQSIARGPVAAFVAIKQVGTNGGGFFGANAAHPFENPSQLTNAIECALIFLLPMSSVWMFGRITRRMRHAIVIWAVMAILLASMVVLADAGEHAPARAMAGLPVQVAPNLEGKELRCGVAASSLWGAATTATSNGSVNSMHDSFNPLTSLVTLSGMWMNVAFGGVGVGFLNMFIYIIIGVFISGMMVGRTPEYFNRRVETPEMKLAVLTLLLHPFLILGGTALFAVTGWGGSAIHNPGAHGFTEILYEFSSAAANNGSGFEGLADATPAWNVVTGMIMLAGRFIPILLPLAIGGLLATKKSTPETSGTLRTDTVLFGVIIAGCVVFIGALLFLPVAVLGPMAEHLTAGM